MNSFVKFVSANYTFDPLTKAVEVTTGSSVIVVTLPDAVAPRRQNIVTVKKIDSGAGTVSIVATGSQTINGKASYTLNAQYQSVTLFRDGVNWIVVTGNVNDQVGATGQSVQIMHITELITLAAAATSDSVADLLPANALILGVTARVTVTTPTTATLSIGDPTTAARFASGMAIAAGTTQTSFIAFNPANTNAAGPVQGSAAKIRITPNATPGNALGRVRVTVFYISLVPSTS